MIYPGLGCIFRRTVSAISGPTNTVAPAVTGSATIKQTLTTTSGTWTGNGTITYAYQWQRNGADIATETATTYILANADFGASITCKVTATDLDGSTATSGNSTVGTALAPVTTAPTITGGTTPGSTLTWNIGAVAWDNQDQALSGSFVLDWLEDGVSTGASGSTFSATLDGSTYTVSQTNTNIHGQVGNTAVSAGHAIAAATAPAAFGTGDWSLADAVLGSTMTITLTAMPSDGGSAITDVEYELDASGTWTTTGLSATGSFNITGLTDTTSYDVKIRAVNGVGNGTASALKAATPTAAASETARFGTWNGTSYPADYVVSAGGLTNGTYGEFTVTGGNNIAPNVPNLTAGAVTVSGYPVEVLASYRAVKSQAEFDAAVAGITDMDNKDMIVRVGAEIATFAHWSRKAYYRRTVINSRIFGDGSPAWETTNFHLANVTTDNPSKLEFHNLSFRSIFNKSDVTYGPIVRGVWEDCHFGDSDPDPNSTAWATAGPTAGDPFTVNGGRIHGLRVKNCTFRGGGTYAHILAAYNDWCELLGNRFDKYYADAIKVRGADPLIIEGNTLTRNFGLASDTTGPHSDGIQFENMSGSSTWVFSANFAARGNSRGTVSSMFYFAGAAGVGFDGYMDGNGAIVDGITAINFYDTNGLQIEYNGSLPEFDAVGATVGNNLARNYVLLDTGSDTLFNYNFGGDATAPGTVSPATGNVAIDGYTKANLTSYAPNWDISAITGLPTQWDLWNAFAVASGQPLAATGPQQIVTITPGAVGSAYTIAAGQRPTPVLTAGAVTPGTTDFTGSVSSDVAKLPLFWAIVPRNTVVTTAGIKERSIAGALDHGFAENTATGTINITGTAAALVTATNYDLVMFQEFGMTAKSAITTVQFTTN